jgi:hypothetical protein
MIEQALRRRQVGRLFARGAPGRDVGVLVVLRNEISTEQHPQNHIRLDAADLNLVFVPIIDLLISDNYSYRSTKIGITGWV